MVSYAMPLEECSEVGVALISVYSTEGSVHTWDRWIWPVPSGSATAPFTAHPLWLDLLTIYPTANNEDWRYMVGRRLT